MELHFQDPGLEYSLSSIMEFQAPGVSDWWRNSLFHFYPQVDRTRFDTLDAGEREGYLRRALTEVYASIREELEEKTRTYYACWEKHRGQVEDAFSDAFELDTGTILNDITVNITLNPICPRFLGEKRFDLFYRSSPQGALGLSLHELTHFLWFRVWRELFGDDPAEYETPHLKWVLSELVVDPILSNDRLCTLNPYYPGGVAYEYFYSMKVDDRPLLEVMGAAYREKPIRDFMTWAWEYCQKHETEIRRQMK